MKHTNYLLLLLVVLISLSCNPEKDFDFQGKWQSLNEKGTVIDISESGDYEMFKDKSPFYENSGIIEGLKIRTYGKKGEWYKFVIEEGELKKEFLKGRIEIVDSDRLRIYVHKHHNILDVADEYHRVDDFNSFRKVMDKILAKPDH